MSQPQSQRPLPAGWSSASANEVCEKIQDGTHFSPKVQLASGRYRYVTAKNVRPWGIDLEHITYLAEQDHRAIYARCDTKKADVLLVKDGVNAGDAALNTIDDEISLLSSVCFLRPREFLMSGFLRYYLLSPQGGGSLTANLTGTAIRRIVLERIRDLPVMIAPPVEQQRIVEVIDSHLSRVDEADEALERVRRNLKRYQAAVLKAAVEGRLVPTEAELARAEGRTYEPASELLKRILVERRHRWEAAELAQLKAAHRAPTDDKWKAKYKEPDPLRAERLPKLPEGWCWTTVDVAGDVLLGRRRAPEYTGPARPYLRVANVRDNRIDLDHVREMSFNETEFLRYQLQPGDILVSEGQSAELVGQSAIYRGVRGLCFQATLHRFRPVPHGPGSEFAQLVFRAHVRTGVFTRLASITTNIAHLTLERFKAAPFPLPPAAEQPRIVEACERLLTLAEDIDHLASATERRSERLRQSILKWAFEGKLVDQDPSDEPASALLERIRAERAARPENGGDKAGRGRRLASKR